MKASKSANKGIFIKDPYQQKMEPLANKDQEKIKKRARNIDQISIPFGFKQSPYKD